MGTFFLVFIVGCCVASPTPAPWAPVSIGAALTVLIYATYKSSGGQLNPAVTFALALLGKKSVGALVSTWLFQFAGAFAAAATYKMVCAPHLAVVAPVAPFHAGYALGAEVIYTAVLVFVVLNCTRTGKSKEPHPFFGLAIGFAAMGGGYAVGHISGAALNPAVSVALGMGGGKDHHWAFAWFGAELAGSGAATGLFWLLRRSELSTDGTESSSAPVEGDTGAAEVPPDGAGPAVGWKHKCAAEALGTFVLMTTFGLNIISGSRATAYSASAVLMCMIYSLGDLSGGHFNPAVTLAVLGGGGKVTRGEAAKYMLAQVVAALLAALVYAAFHMGSAVGDKSIKLLPGKGYDIFQAGLAELLGTFVLGYTVLAVTMEGYCKEVGGLVISLAVLAGGFAVGSVSGGELNPALVLGLVLGNVVNPGKGGVGAPAAWLVLLVCEFLGAYVSSVIFRITHRLELMPDDDEDDVKGLSKADVEAPVPASKAAARPAS